MEWVWLLDSLPQITYAYSNLELCGFC